MNLKGIFDKSWTLFLDRDGVINKKIENGYVLEVSMFEFIEGSVLGIAKLSKTFGKVIVVTNQRGIGRNLMSLEDLEAIHKFMISEVEKGGGVIDGIFFCPHDYEKVRCNCRKPDIGLALQAKEVFPDIDFSKSVVVGDSLSDMEFAKRIGALRVKIGYDLNSENFDYCFDSLLEFSLNI